MKHDPFYFDNCLYEMKEMFSLTGELFFELNDAFFEIASQQIDMLRIALLQKDMEQLILHSHTLKGSSASLRHQSISLIAAGMERHAKEGTSFNFATTIFELSEEIATLRSLYMQWKAIHLPNINNAY